MIPNERMVVVFVKAPTPGRAKTRLLPFLSPEEAAGVYRWLAQETLATVQMVRDTQVVIAYAADEQFPDLQWLTIPNKTLRAQGSRLKAEGNRLPGPPSALAGAGEPRASSLEPDLDVLTRPWPTILQQGEGLGERLTHAFAWAFGQGARQVVAIGSDAPELSAEWIKQAFLKFRTRDIVLGPTPDGGYHLIGMKRLYPELFMGMPWSSSKLFALTVSRIRQLELSHACLPPIADLDTVDDLCVYLKRSANMTIGHDRLLDLQQLERRVRETPMGSWQAQESRPNKEDVA